MKYLINFAVITGADPVQVFCTGKLVCIERNWLCNLLRFLGD